MVTPITHIQDKFLKRADLNIQQAHDLRSGVDFIICFKPYTNLLHPSPKFYATKKASQKLGVGYKIVGGKTVFEIDPRICLDPTYI